MCAVCKLKNEIKVHIENRPISMDNLMDVAHRAAHFTQFKEMSSLLLLTCSKFLQKTIRIPADQLKFVRDQYHEGRERTALHLLDLFEDLPSLCINCNEVEENCLDGKLVSVEKMVFI